MTGTLDRVGADPVDTGRPGPPQVPPWLVGTVLAIAVAVLGFRLGAGTDTATAAAAAGAVLVAGFPGALLLVDRAIRGAGGHRATRLGMPSADLAVLGRADTVLLPRTGLVTTGAAEVAGITLTEGVARDDVLRLAAAVEQPCAHVLGRAVRAAVPAGVRVPDVADFDLVPGLGVRGVVVELTGSSVVAHAVLVGSPDFLLDHGVELPTGLAAARDAVEAAGRSPVAVAWDGVARAVLDVADPVRDGAAGALAGLARLGVRPVLVTGSRRPEVLAGQVGVAADAVVAGVPPGGAAAVARRLRACGRVVAAVGPDGGGDVDLPAGPDGVLGVLDAVALARRTRRTAAAVRATTSVVAVLGAAGAAAGLTGPVGVLTAPAVGLLAVAAGAMWVAVHGGHREVRTGGAGRRPPVPPPDRATCG